MTKQIYFTLEENPAQPSKYRININFDLLPKMSTPGSYTILFARLMNLSFAQFLRMCRDVCGAEIVGKNSKYPSIYFKKNINTVAFVRLLNSRMNYVVWEREHPDWKEHQDFLAQRKKEYTEVWKDVSNT